MASLRRSVVVVALALLVAGCGGSSAAPSHGLLFTYLAKPASWHRGGDIYAWTPGSAPRRIFATGSPAVNPQWSPDGTSIAWSMTPPALCKSEADECGKFECEDQVYVSHDGGPPERVSPDYTDSDGNAGCSELEGWSPDGKRLLILRSSSAVPSSFAILDPATGALQPLHLPGAEYGPASWGKPGIAYVSYNAAKARRGPPYGQLYGVRVVAPSPGGPKFAIPFHTNEGGGPLAWSSRGELATIDGKRIVIYSSSGRKVADFTGPKYPAGPANGSGLLWSLDGKRLLVCIDPFGGLNPYERQMHVNTAAKRSHYPPLVSFVVDRDGTHWQRFDIPNPQPKESACAATSWR